MSYAISVLQDRWDRGMRTDVPRDKLPAGSYYKAYDVIPDFHGWPLAQRGRWVYYSSALGGSATQIVAGIYAPYLAGAKTVVIDEDSHLWWNGTDKGGTFTPYQNPVFYRDLVVIPISGGACQSVNSAGTTAALTGAPTALYAAPYKSRLLLANGYSANTQRVWVNGLNSTTGAPDPNSWNTADNGDWFDLPEAVTGLAALRTACLIFTANKTFRLRGTSPGRLGDMALDPMFTFAGCYDARSITAWEDNVIWADLNGIYMSDGATLVNLAEQAQITKDWQTNGGASTARIACGVYLDWLFVTQIVGGSSTTYLFDLSKRVCVSMLTNFTVQTYWSAPSTLVGGLTDEARAITASYIFSLTDAGGGKDEDNTSYRAAVETAFYRASPGSSRVKHVYVGYGQRYDSTIPDTAPQTNVRYINVFNYRDTGYYPYQAALLNATTDGTTAEQTTRDRKRGNVLREMDGIALRIEPWTTGRTRNWGIDTLEAEQWPVERYRV